MLKRFWRRRTTGVLPHYSRLKATPSIRLPAELEELEESDSHVRARDTLQRGLLDADKRPSDEDPLFTELLVRGGGVVTIPYPEGGGACLPVFSTPLRAVDYVRTLLTSDPKVQFLSSSPVQLLGMLHEVRQAGIESFTIDRCPRCPVFTAFGIASMKAASDLVEVWAINKATEQARAELYFAYALKSARAGEFERARDVALEAVGHVSMEDPRLHMLLGQLGVAVNDGGLLREAKAFLRFLGLMDWEEKLSEVERSGEAEFAGPE